MEPETERNCSTPVEGSKTAHKNGHLMTGNFSIQEMITTECKKYWIKWILFAVLKMYTKSLEKQLQSCTDRVKEHVEGTMNIYLENVHKHVTYHLTANSKLTPSSE